MKTHSSFLSEETVDGIESLRHEKNGLHVLLVPQRIASVVTVMITYRVGSRNEVSGTTGATHLLEHLMFKGTDRFNAEKGTSVFNVLQRTGAMVNATTWLDRTNYYALLPSNEVGRALEIESDRMRNARISEQALRDERTVVLNEYDRGQNEPVRSLYHAVWASAFQAHSYHHPTIGWRSDIENVTHGQLKSFYDTYYWPNNATLSVIGDFDRDELLDLVHNYFGAIPSSPDPIPAPTTCEPEQLGERRVSLRKAGDVTNVIIAYKSPEAVHADTPALDILSAILTSGKNSRLYRALVDAGLVTSLGANQSMHLDPGLFSIYLTLADSANPDDVEAVVYSEIEKIVDSGVEPVEVEREIGYRKAQEAYARDGSFHLAAQLNEAIASGDWKLFVRYMDLLQAVSPEDIQRVAERYLTETGRTVGIFHPVKQVVSN